jgi:hypothetical protein
MAKEITHPDQFGEIAREPGCLGSEHKRHIIDRRQNAAARRSEAQQVHPNPEKPVTEP